MGGGGGKDADYDMPEVKEPDPVAPPSPAARSDEASARAAEQTKLREKKRFGQSKTILSRGQGLGGDTSGAGGNKTLG